MEEDSPYKTKNSINYIAALETKGDFTDKAQRI